MELPVTIIRTRNRNSRALLTPQGIEIRLAGKLPSHIERHHIESLVKRMQKIAMRERTKTSIDPFSEILRQRASGEIHLSDSRAVEVRWKDGKSTSIKSGDGHLSLTVGPTVSNASIHRLLWRGISAHEQARIEQEVRMINDATFKYRIRSVRLRHTVTQWGSCGSSGQICLAASLLFVPMHLRTYVIVHEVAHLRYRGHGQRFWKLVESALPDYKERIKELRNYRMTRIR